MNFKKYTVKHNTKHDLSRATCCKLKNEKYETKNDYVFALFGSIFGGVCANGSS